MKACDFLDTCLLLDLEARGDHIYRIGALRGEASFERRGRFDLRRTLAELDAFSSGAAHLLGHNILDHDLPILVRHAPDLRFLGKPVIDTLYLSPLAFPENPYHRLIKDYKLVKDALSDPVADARLAASVFEDQWQSFAGALSHGPSGLLSIYRFSFEGLHACAGKCREGFSAVFDALGVAPLGEDEATELLRRLLEGRVCSRALEKILSARHSSPPFEERAALAYVTAWLQVAGASSVLPPWVRHRFPAVVTLLQVLRDVPCDDDPCSYCRTTNDPRVQLERYFSFSGFRAKPVLEGSGVGLQEAIVRAGMREQSLLAILPTGGGKSLCYQLPALVRHFRRGVLTVVISPLQALMKDQVDNLTAKTGSPSAAALYGLLTAPERGEVLDRVRLGDVAILYVAPEQFRNRSFYKAIAQREIGCWVFDEAHCLSKWGHDFRPDYLYAGRFIREFSRDLGAPIPPVACFTATAKVEVKQEIMDFFRQELGQSLLLFEGGLERENLHFEVQMVTRPEKLSRIHEVLGERLGESSSGSALVYTATRRNAEEAGGYLQRQGWPAAAYHAGLSVPEKRAVQEGFARGEIRVICATNAFGMGIDKEDIRLVLHADIPGSLENYLQEAGRAGRDLRDAECVLLYNEQDIETQFKLGAASELNQRDIAQILRGLRRARRNEAGEVVITTGELLREEEVETSFDTSDVQADTKVKTAVAWLERAGFLERNQNSTRVFQGRPLVKSLSEARERMEKLNLSTAQKERWLGVLETLMNAAPDEGLSADELAELPAFKQKQSDAKDPGQFRATRSDTEQVMRTLHGMAEAGLIKQGLLLTAFVRHKVKNHSELIFERVCALEGAMLKIMRESAPDAAEAGWLDLSLRKLNQRLLDEGHSDSNPQVLLSLLKSLSMDGKGLAGNRGSIEVRQAFQDQYRLKVQRNWEALVATAGKRRAIAKTALEAILARVPPDTPPSAEVLVDFSADDITRAIRSNIYLCGQIKDSLAAMDRGLMFLHEQRAIVLQQGLAVFRQAMTIRVVPQEKRRPYARGDYEPLSWHYREKILQIHVMNEYARLGLEKIRQALELVLAYFGMEKTAFVKRFFAGRKEIVERATGEESYRRVVESLRNRSQAEIVTAAEEANMLVLAGPGSGKTRVVVHRCAYLLRVKRVPARAILVLCFNRSAAVALRRRLWELVGPDARGVMVQTYHSLAMRLTGSSFADLAQRAGSDLPPFDQLIPEAIRLLRGEKEVLGLEADELRDRLLAGYSHILVDEYQDIDREQYELISALAGRTEQDQDRKLAILAVGDDDQNIYTFRGANVSFIRRFQEDYGASLHYLVENYRCTRNIVSAANALIASNADRMKTEQTIRIDRNREEAPEGGAWSARDPVSRGKVQLLQVRNAYSQAIALANELQRLQRLKPDLQWSDCAILSRTRETLHPIRAMLEYRQIPLTWGLARDKAPGLHRVREIEGFLDGLNERRKELLRASDLESMLSRAAAGREQNPWYALLGELLASWREESGDTELPAAHATECIYEALAEQRREHAIGHGVFLGTVHGAKGMEFDHVFMLDGGWSPPGTPSEGEEERRLFYVGMTRARETLCLFERKDIQNPHVRLLHGEFVRRRPGSAATLTADPVAAELMPTRYALLGMQDIFLSHAAAFPAESPVHRHLAALEPGSALIAHQAPRQCIELQDMEGYPVCMLSKAAAKAWAANLGGIRSIRVIAMIRRRRKDSQSEFRQSHRCESWEVPWVEVIYAE
jgi:ATP-dependent DNA helicase RecQ